MMGGKFEIRWKRNRGCPFWIGEFAGSLTVAYEIFGRAVSRGFSCVELILHDWADCPADCGDRCEGCGVGEQMS